MFAVSRTLRVIGRIKFLNLSINTIKEIKYIGVFWGVKWTINFSLEFK